MLAAAKPGSRGMALMYAADELKKDRDFFRAAVRQNGWALYAADSDLKKDRDIVWPP